MSFGWCMFRIYVWHIDRWCDRCCIGRAKYSYWSYNRCRECPRIDFTQACNKYGSR